MDRVEIVKWANRAYLVLSGAYVTYSLYRFTKKVLRRHRNSLASTVDYSKRKKQQQDAKLVQNQQQQNQGQTELSIEYDNMDYWKIESIAEAKQASQQQQNNSFPSGALQDEQSLKSSHQVSSFANKTKNNSVMNLVELATVLPKAIVEEEKHKIIKVCLTGGPCAGKTSGVAFLSEKLRDDEFHVFVVPEAATLIANGGGMLDFGGYNTTEILDFQKALMQVQIALEDQFYRLAQLSKSQSIILCDRGLLDGKAFLSQEQWEQLLKDMKFSEKNLRDERYDSVVHLVTAADGAAEHYVQDGVRFQNLEQAVDIDKKFQEAYLGHQQLEIIDNKSVNNFQQKLEKLLFTVRKLSGVPVKGRKLYKRYAIIDPESHPNLPDDLQVESFEIEDTFLYKAGYNEQEGKLTKIRKRIQGNDVIYMCSESHIIEGKQTIFFKKRLNFREYLLVKDQQDRERQTIKKNRRQFVYAGYFYSLDKFKDFDMCILRLKNSSGIDESDVVIPDFLQVDCDVTEHSEFKSLNLSLKDSPLRDTEQLHEIVHDLYQTQKDIINFQQRLRPKKPN